MSISRRSFVGLSAVAVGGVGVPLGRSFGVMQPDAAVPRDAAPWLPRTSNEDAQAVVGASRANIEVVREMVTQRPALARSAIDWGFGDWESALGAASHTGRREIAELLIAHGARPNLFTLAMLGHVDAVRATLQAMPGVQRIKGPHGITLMSHARAGRDEAASVVEYLESVGGADEQYVNEPVDDAAAISGAYTLEPRTPDGTLADDAPNDHGRFEIAEGRRGLEFRAEGTFARNLFHQGGLAFNPAGAEAVLLRFEPAAAATRVAIELGDRTVWATRDPS
ncbi:MAG: twin-arginine translocation signal domain-containing protein [Phycisphaerales bacterium]|nr:twin-arginine translocation signal domain-containing protein [Phycisphaerales bacterium]MCB9840994.1 twin-arginine translocation signal domain-containing protein [Phycisphaeraceae bacterium]